MLNAEGAQEQLVELFAGDHPPTFVVEYQTADDMQPERRGRRASSAGGTSPGRSSTAWTILELA